MLFTKSLEKIDNKLKKDPIIYFIHIPKTSGKSISGQRLKSMGHKFNVEYSYRTPASEGGFIGYKTKYWPKCIYSEKNSLKITIIRNPFDLLCSYYHHGKELKGAAYSHSGWGAVNYTHQFKSFDEFIRAYCDIDFEWHQPLFKRFLFSQLFDENDNCVPDLIIKYEYLDEALEILRKNGIEIKREKTNISSRKKKAYTDYYNKELRTLVEKKCERELDIFRYNFDNSLDDSYFIMPDNLNYNVKKNWIYFK